MASSHNGHGGHGDFAPSLAGNSENLDVWDLIGAVRRRLPVVALVTLGIIVLAGFVVLSLTPRYLSESQILVENGESTFTRPERTTNEALAADQAAVLSQVQVLLSRDLAARVSTDVGLAEIDEFSGKGRKQPLYMRLLSHVGFGDEKVSPTDDRVLETYYKRLSVRQIDVARVIAIRFSAEDAALSAKVANALADAYIAASRQARFTSDQDAAAWLKGEIDDLRTKVADAEQAVERFRSGNGLVQSGRDTSLNQQQLSEINTQLTTARGLQSEAKARAVLVKRLIKQPGGLDAAVEVLNSRLIQRLRELQAAQSRDIAELSATLLPGHPRMKQLKAEKADIDRRIRSEIKKIAVGLENEADIAAARVSELKKALTGYKKEASDAKTAEVEMRALERESKAQRDLLENYMRRYREASARSDVRSQPAAARIISRATIASKPNYPAKGPIMALSSVGAILMGLVAAFMVEMFAPQEAMPRPAQRVARSPYVQPDFADVPPIGDHEAGAFDSPVGGFPTLVSQNLALAPEPMVPPPPLPSAFLSQAHQNSMQHVARETARMATNRQLRRMISLDLDGSFSGSRVAFETAKILAQPGHRAVLIEADDKRHLTGLANLPAGPGLAEVMIGSASLSEVVSVIPDAGLSLISGGNCAFPSQLPFDRLLQVVEALEARFRFVVILAGHMSPATMPLAGQCNLTLLNATSQAIAAPSFKASLISLTQAGVTDAVVITNGADGISLYQALQSKGPMTDVA